MLSLQRVQLLKFDLKNKGRGVAIDLGNDSKVNFGKNSTNTFHSVGKGPKSGGGLQEAMTVITILV